MTFVESICKEYLVYKTLGERSLAQLSDDQLSASLAAGTNSVAAICWHISGNLKSRFTDFLTTDGEKEWRNREEEFEPRSVTRQTLLAKWEEGWAAVLGALDGLNDDDLRRTVTIRSQPLEVHAALHRSLAHTAHHVGQIVYVAHALKGGDWTYLSIPPGQSSSFNDKMKKESSA
jgi:uncharacterized damage-inducible protein DinB